MNSQFDKYRNSHSINTFVTKRTSLLFFGILVIVVYVLQIGIIGIRNWLAPQGSLLKLMVIANQLFAILLPTFLFLIIFRLPTRQALGLYAPPWIKTILAVVLGFVLIYAVNYVLPQIIPPTQKFTTATSSIIEYRNLLEFLLTFLTISVVAPLADELFFRGILLRFLMMRYGKIVAIIITALLTALFHSLEPFKLTHSFIMGVIFATSVVWTNSVYTSIILHGLHNALALLPQG